MKVIETKYKGYKFRSRLEARWAVFFDACGVKWEYEPEGFDLGNGVYYLPDFLLHNVLFRNDDTPQDLWIEVKGKMNATDAEKIIRFSNTDNDEGVDVENPILVVTNIPHGETFSYDLVNCMRNLAYSDDEAFEFVINGQIEWLYPFNFQLIDGDYFGAFPCVNEQGKFMIMDDNWRCVGDVDEKATANAYRLARQARFEHHAGRKF